MDRGKDITLCSQKAAEVVARVEPGLMGVFLHQNQLPLKAVYSTDSSSDIRFHAYFRCEAVTDDIEAEAGFYLVCVPLRSAIDSSRG
jgi:hypothetical protein